MKILSVIRIFFDVNYVEILHVLYKITRSFCRTELLITSN